MKQVIIIGFVILLLAPAVFALDKNGNPTSFDDLVRNIDTLNADLKNRERTIPALLSFLLGDHIIDAQVTRRSGSVEKLTVEIENGKITKLAKGMPEDPTMEFRSDETTVDVILLSQDPVRAFRNALSDGSATLRGVGFGNKLKVGSAKVVNGIMNFFSGLFRGKQDIECGQNLCKNARANDQCIRYSCGGNIQTELLCPGTPFQQELCPVLRCGDNVCVGAAVGAQCVRYSCGGGKQTPLLCPGTPFEQGLCGTLRCGSNVCVGVAPHETCVRYSCGGSRQSLPVCPGTPFNQALCV